MKVFELFWSWRLRTLYHVTVLLGCSRIGLYSYFVLAYIRVKIRLKTRLIDQNKIEIKAMYVLLLSRSCGVITKLACVAGPQFYGGPDLQSCPLQIRPPIKLRACHAGYSETSYFHVILLIKVTKL